MGQKKYVMFEMYFWASDAFEQLLKQSKILKVLTKPHKRQHEILIEKLLIHYLCTFFVASKFKSNQKSLQVHM